MFVFFCSHAISVVLAMSFFVACLAFMLILYDMKGIGSRAYIIYFYFSMGLDVVLTKVPTHPTRWASAPIVSFLAMPVGLLATILTMRAC